MNTNPKIYEPFLVDGGWDTDYADMRWRGRLEEVKDTKWILSERFVKAEDYLKLASAYKKLEAKHARQQRYVSVVRKLLHESLVIFNPPLGMRLIIQDLLNKGEWKKHE